MPLTLCGGQNFAQALQVGNEPILFRQWPWLDEGRRLKRHAHIDYLMSFYEAQTIIIKSADFHQDVDPIRESLHRASYAQRTQCHYLAHVCNRQSFTKYGSRGPSPAHGLQICRSRRAFQLAKLSATISACSTLGSELKNGRTSLCHSACS
jgi:hypothetical protein